MSFNGIKFATSVPGMIPWEIVLAYFVIATGLVLYFSKKIGFKGFTTIDLVYIGIGAAFSVVWEFYIGAFISRAIPSTPFVSITFWGRMFIVFIVAALVRKPGVGMLSLTIFDVLADIFHYGFGGQPLYFIYEALTYGLFVDIMIVISRGKLFGIGYKPSNGSVGIIRSPALIAAIQGAVLGLLWAIPDPIFYYAFFRPLIYGAIVNWQYAIFHLIAFIPGDIIIGIIAAITSLRIVKAVGQ